MIGEIVRSTAGHDKGKLYVVIQADDTYVYLADGRIRKICNLKKKKIRHVELMNKKIWEILPDEQSSPVMSNESIKRKLKHYAHRVFI